MESHKVAVVAVGVAFIYLLTPLVTGILCEVVGSGIIRFQTDTRHEDFQFVVLPSFKPSGGMAQSPEILTPSTTQSQLRRGANVV